MENANTRFEAGKTYNARSICDHECVWIFEIVRRTEKSVWVKGCNMNDKNEIVRRKIDIFNGEENFSPFGCYSMSPVCGAENCSGSAA